MTDIDPVPFLELPGSQQRLAREIARLTAEELAPGMGSLILAPHSIEALATFQPWHFSQGLLYSGAQDLRIEGDIRPGGPAPSISLTLWLNGYRCWAGVLRGG